MQPWIYSYKEDRDESFKNGLQKINCTAVNFKNKFRTNQTKQITEQNKR